MSAGVCVRACLCRLDKKGDKKKKKTLLSTFIEGKTGGRLRIERSPLITRLVARRMGGGGGAHSFLCILCVCVLIEAARPRH